MVWEREDEKENVEKKKKKEDSGPVNLSYEPALPEVNTVVEEDENCWR